MRDLPKILHRQKRFSVRAFGPGERVAGVIDHIRKELAEVEQNPRDLEEWIDIAMLAMDGAWRAGFTAEQIAAAYVAKLEKNENREWQIPIKRLSMCGLHLNAMVLMIFRTKLISFRFQWSANK